MTTSLRRPVAAAALALAAALFSGAGLAQKKPSDITVQEFFKRAQYSQMVLSPDGSKLAAITPLKGRDNLAVVDLDKRTSNVITSFEKLDAGDIFWVNNKRLCLRVFNGQQVTGEPSYRGLYCINWDGEDLRNHTEAGTAGSRSRPFPIAPVSAESDEYIMGMNGRSRRSVDVYRFNTVTGRHTILTQDSPGDVGSWVLDRNLVPRIAVSAPEREFGERGRGVLRTATVWHRADADAKWEKLWEYKIDDPTADVYEPVAFDYDNEAP